MKLCPACNKTYPDEQTFCPEDSEVLQESPESFVGSVIDGKYRVEGFIAQGGMGAVYRARHILLGDDVVIKTLRAEMRNNAEWLRRFQREGKAARAFRHPNAVTVYDLSSDGGGMIYMVMEYVEGHTLASELKRRGRFTPAEALEVLRPVADVLDAAHARGVVHRDLKPENIMLGSDGRGGTVVKLLDLGIAKIVGGGEMHSTRVTTSLTMAGQILGTPYYMSPEQWGELPRDGNAEVDGRTDVYSLGVIFFELVAGRRPLGGSTLSELRQNHVAAQPPVLSEAAPGVPEAFGRAVARALAKDRADRPPSAGSFVEELRAALGLPPHANASAPHKSDSGSVLTLDAGRRGGVTPAEGLSDAATARLARDTSSEPGDGAGADTILTEEFEPPGAAVSVDAPEPRRPRAPLFAGGALALLLVAGVGGWLAWRGRGAEPAPETPQPARAAPAPKVEAASYWFESFEEEKDRAGRRVAELSPTLASDTWLKIHFVARRRGYLYIIGPGRDGNARMTFLTAKGARALKSNYVGAGADFSLPFGDKKIWIDTNPGADEFNFIFSPTPLMSPSFLAGENEHELTPAEVAEWEQFRARYEQDAPELDARGEGGGRQVVVLAPGPSDDAGGPLIFDVRVDHR